MTKIRTRGRLVAAGVVIIGGSILAVTPSSASSPSSNPGGPPPIIIGPGGGGESYWGWDELAEISSTQLSSYETTLGGAPETIGQYLYQPGGSPDLTSTEVSLFHNHAIGIYLLMDPNQNVTTSTEADSDVSEAVTQAENLGAPNNNSIIIFRDIEPGTSVTALYLNEYYAKMSADGFIPGFYEGINASHTNFQTAFCGSNSSTTSGSALWAGYPQQNTSNNPPYPSAYRKSSKPTNWAPNNPNCDSLGNTTESWQYQAEESNNSPVDADDVGDTGAW